MPTPLERPVAILGGGTMASAMLRAWLAHGQLLAEQVIVAERDQTKHAILRRLGTTDGSIGVTHTAAQAIAAFADLEHLYGNRPGVIFLAVKPQSFPELAAEILPALKEHPGPNHGKRRLMISIMAGLTCTQISAALGGEASVNVMRAMPNTPARIGMGVTSLSPIRSSTDADAIVARRLLSALGPTLIELDEDKINAFAALAGSGPAYLFYLAEAMTAGGVAAGLDAQTVDRLVRATIAGSSALLSHAQESAFELRAQVTSKGGMTEAATATFDSKGVMDAITQGILAARDRGRELAK